VELTVLAVDWTGALSGERTKLWLAQARHGKLERLECGRTRAELVAHLIELAQADRQLAVGFDFSFSLPAWFLRHHGLNHARELWHLAAREGESWLREVPPPFWGRAGRRRPPSDPVRPPYRATESQLPTSSASRPKSTFQLGGAGSVGTGSLRGMPQLLTLQQSGFSIAPFDPPCPPIAFEIYPRYLTGPVNKSSPAARAARLLRLDSSELPPAMRRLAISSEDAFDAALSALAISRAPQSILQPAPPSPDVLLEGRIFLPHHAPSHLARRR
jgi:hypothetical protein